MHEKYTYKDGKKYGPYLYETKRVDGRVVTTYLGNEPQSKISRYFVVVGIGILLVLLAYAFYLKTHAGDGSLTGKVLLDIKFVYKLNEPVDGHMIFRIREGELVPKDSMVEIVYGDQSKTVPLSSLVNDATISGDYYAENSQLSGSGEGYGAAGTKIVYPVVNFKVHITRTDQSSTSESSSSTTEGSTGSEVSGESGPTESSSESTEGSGSSSSESSGTDSSSDDSSNAESSDTSSSSADSSSNSESSSSSSDNSAPAGDSGSSSESSSGDSSGGITGAVLSETDYIIDGSASYDAPYNYNLESDQIASIVPGSVTADGKSLPDQTVAIQIENGKLVASTGYFVNDKGFGKEYLGDYALSLDVDVLKLGLKAVPGDIEVKLVSGEETIASQKQSVTVLSEPGEEETNLQDAIVVNQTYAWAKDIPTIRVNTGESTQLDLAEYFPDADSFDVVIPNVAANVDGSVITFTPEADFKGIRLVKILAYKGDSIIESNEFKLLVSGLNIVTSRDRIEVGQRVKWTKEVSLDQAGAANVELPANAADITVTKVTDSGEETETPTVTAVSGSSISGNVVIDLDLRKEPAVFRWWRSFVNAITGKAVDTEDLEPKLDVALEGAKDYVVEYYTDAPTAVEEDTDRGKVVTISGPDAVTYTDVLASASIDDSLHAKEDQIRIIWTSAPIQQEVSIKEVADVPETIVVEDTASEPVVDSTSGLTGNVISESAGNSDAIISQGDVELPFDAYDTNNDGSIDYVEWIVPHLSNQTFEIILISKADHLNSSREYISDIYPQVKELDGNWSETIANGEFVRATFEINLSARNDITVYPRIIEGNPIVNVYQKDSNVTLATFDPIVNDSYNKVYLSLLEGTQDVFDLEILNGSLQFDHITDPTPFNATTLNVQRGSIVGSSSSRVDAVPTVPFGTTSSFLLHSTRSNSNQPTSVLVAGNVTNSTTLHFERYGAGTLSTEWQIVDGGSSKVSVQSGLLPNSTINSSMGSLFVGLPSEVNTSASFIIVSSQLGTTTSTQYTRGFWTGEFVNSTTINVTRGVTGTAGVVSWQVVQINDSLVYSGVTPITSNSNSVTLPGAVNTTTSFLIFSTRASGTSYPGSFVQGTLVNGTIVRFDRNSTAASGTVVSWFVVSDPAITVQTGSVYLNSTDSGQNVTINSVNLSQSFSITSFQSNETSILPTPGRAMVSNQLASATQLQLLKSLTLAWDNVTWQVITFGTTLPIAGSSYPSISFVSPTPANASTLAVNALVVNVSTSGTSQHSTLVDFNRDLRLWMRFDDLNSSGDPIDLSSWSNNGSLSGDSASSVASGYFGNKLSLGGTDDYVRIPHSNSISGLTEITLSAWFNTTTSASAVILGKHAGATNGEYYIATAAGGSTVRLTTINSGSSRVDCDATATYNDGVWHHLVGTYNGSQASVYLDGVNLKNCSQTGTLKSFSTADLIIGNYQGLDWDFTGNIDDVAIFNRSLTALEVRALYNSSDTQYYRNFTGLADGTYTVSAYAQDLSGNLNSTYLVTTLLNSAPSINVSSPLNASYIAVQTALNYTVTNSPQACWYTLNGGVTNVSVTCGTNVTGLNSGQGSSTWTVYANNSGGLTNRSSVTFFVDSVTPTIQFVSPTETNASTITRTNIAINVTASDTNLATLIIRMYNSTGLVNSSIGSSATNFANFTLLPAGTYYFNATANDTLGNTNSTETYIVTISTAAPGLNLTYPLNTTYTTVQTALNYTVTNSPQACWYSLDSGATNTTISCGTNVTGLTSTQGSNTWKVYANNTAGVVNSSGVTFYVDSLAPEIQIVIPGAGNYSTTSLSLDEWSAADTNLQACWYNMNNGANISLLCNFEYPSLSVSQGTNTLTVYANDTLGNTNFSSVVLFVDSLKPTIDFVSPTPADGSYQSSTTVAINVTGTETNFGTGLIELDGTNYTMTCSGSSVYYCNYTFTGLSSANHTIIASVNDTLGNRNVTSARTFTIDNVAPAINFTNPTESNNSYLSRSNININVTATDANLANISIGLFNSTGLVNRTTTLTSPNFVNITGLVDGRYYFNASASDSTSNMNNTETMTVVIDRTNPLLSYGAGTPADGSYQSSTSIYLNVTYIEANFANITFLLSNYSSDGLGAPTTYNETSYATPVYSINWTNLPEGKYRIIVTVIDLAGNSNQTSNSLVYLDTASPGITVTSPTNTTYTDYNVSINFNFTSASVNVEAPNSNLWFFNGTANESYTSATSRTYGEGSHMFIAYGNDSAGNIGSRTVYFSVNIPVPGLDMTYPLNTSYTSVQTELNYTVTNSPQACWYTLNGGVTNVSVTCGTNVTGLNSGQGSSTWTVYANNSGGLTNRSSVTFFVDSIAPVVLLTNPDNNTQTSSASVFFGANVSDVNVTNATLYIWNSTSLVFTNSSVAGVASAIVNLSYTLPTSNTYYWNYLATDNLGNIAFNSSNRTIVYDYRRLGSCQVLDVANTTYTLLNDVASTVTCFNVTADNITLDLNGYTVRGDSNGSAEYGILINGANTTMVRNGTVADFAGSNIRIVRTSDTNIDRVTVRVNVTHYNAFPLQDCSVAAWEGIYSQNSKRLTITNSNISAPGTVVPIGCSAGALNTNFYGISLTSVNNVSIVNNTLSDFNESGTSTAVDDVGLRFASSSGISIVANNTFARNTKGFVPESALNSPLTAVNNVYYDNYISQDSSGGVSYMTSIGESVYNASNYLAIFAQNSTFTNLTINGSLGTSVYITASGVGQFGRNITFNNLNITNSASGQTDVQIQNAVINDTRFADSYFGKYVFGTNRRISTTVSKTNVAELNFYAGVNGTGTSFSENIILANNFVFVNSSQVGLNRTANVTLYNVPTTFTRPAILRGGTVCPSSVCTNFTSLNAGTVLLSVSSWDANITIGETPSYSISVSIAYPANTTYSLGPSALNYSVSSSSAGTCWYSLDLGVTNTTIACGVNATGLTASQGSNTWKVYANTTVGDLNSSSVTFYVDSLAPTVDFVTPTEANNSILTRTNIQVNVTAFDTNLANVTVRLYNSTGLLNSSFSTSSPLFTNFTGLADGTYMFNATAVDTFGNINSTQTNTITIVSQRPDVNVTYPLNRTYTSVITSLNYTVTNSPQACWYTLNGGVTNVSVTCGTNVTGLNSGQGSSTWTVYANNSGGLTNRSSVTFVVDSFAPQISYTSGTENNGEIVSGSFYVNVSLNETNVANVTYTLYNSTSVVNQTVFSTNVSSLTFTGLSNFTYTYQVNITDAVGNINGTSPRTVRGISSCLGSSCSEGSACTVVTSCMLYSGMCTDGVCDFVNFTIQNASVYTLYNASGDGQGLVLNLTSNSSQALAFRNTASTFVFGGKNGTSFDSGARGGHAGAINITVTGLLNRTNGIFVGVGGYSTSTGTSGGDGGVIQLNYHGLIRSLSLATTRSGNSTSGLSGNAGSTIQVRDSSCPRDADITGNGLINSADVGSLTGAYNNVSEDATFNSTWDINCDGRINVIDLAKLGFEYGTR